LSWKSGKSEISNQEKPATNNQDKRESEGGNAVRIGLFELNHVSKRNKSNKIESV
jgi:hypothetical protein